MGSEITETESFTGGSLIGNLHMSYFSGNLIEYRDQQSKGKETVVVYYCLYTVSSDLQLLLPALHFIL